MLSLANKSGDFLQRIEQQSAAFTDEGYLVLESVLTGDLLSQVSTAVDLLYENHKLGLTKPSLSVDNIINLSRAFHPLIKFEPVYSLLRKLFGPDLNLLSTGMRYNLPGNPNQAWNSDYKRNWENLKPQHPMWIPFPTVVVAYYLDDINLDNGPLWVVPQSHKLVERPEWADKSLEGEKPLMVEKGGCILFDARVWHRGGGNFTDTPRRAVFFDYSLSWVKKPYEFKGTEIDYLTATANSEILQLLGISA